MCECECKCKQKCKKEKRNNTVPLLGGDEWIPLPQGWTGIVLLALSAIICLIATILFNFVKNYFF
jgi:hypothetical protein